MEKHITDWILGISTKIKSKLNNQYRKESIHYSIVKKKGRKKKEEKKRKEE